MKELLMALFDEKINMTERQLHETANACGFDLRSEEYRVIVVSAQQRIDSPESYKRYCVDMPEQCEAFFAARKLRSEITSDHAGKVIILLMEEMRGQDLQEVVNSLMLFLDGQFQNGTIIAVGTCAASISEVAYSYRTALNALNYHSLYSGERCVFCEDMQTMLNLSTLQSVIHPDRMLQAFQANNLDELRLMVTVYAEKVRALSGESIEGRHPTSIRRMFVELTVYVLHIASDVGVDVDSILKGLDPYNFLLANDKSTPMIIDWFIGMCSDLRSAINEKARSKEKNIIQQVCDYIDLHIRQYDLSLDDAAAAVNMTPSYLSKLFHKEMGQGFSKFVVHRRLQIASSLLVETSLPVKEVSERSGFASANYFGAVFKREFGLSPMAYRIHNRDLN